MEITRRDMFQTGGKLLVLASVGATLEQITGAEEPPEAYRMADHWWGMIIDIDKCIGCGNCVRACANENGVPKGYYRTWVERYEVPEGYKNPKVSSTSPSSATTAWIRLVFRSARWARPSSAATAWCWSTRTTAWAAATAYRHAHTAADTFTPIPKRWTSARSVTTASPRG